MKTAIVMGKGSLAVNVAASMVPFAHGYKLIGIVPMLPDPPWCEGFHNWATFGSKIRSHPHHDDLYSKVDLVISAQYGRILPLEFVQRHGRVLNIHFSPLPKYRGMRPINWALKNNELEHGVTIHEVDGGIDTGPIVAQSKFSIYPKLEEVMHVYNRCVLAGTQLWKDILPFVDDLRADPQDWYMDEPSYYSKDDIAQLGDREGFTRTGELSW